MSEEHWCQKCYLTKRTTYVHQWALYICDECFAAVEKMMKAGQNKE